MRIQHSVNNIFFGISGHFISIIMGFIVRSVFIYTLGVEYLGIEGLFTSILLMLSLANLGFDTAIVYSLYKPLAEHDTFKIQALMNLYRKAYRIVGLVVLTIGLSVLPFLSHLLNGSTSVKDIHLIFVLFLIQSVSSYYFVYKQSIVIADQRNHIISKIHSIFVVLSNLSQVILLIVVGNYITVLVFQIGFRIAENIFIAKKTDSLYPYINQNKDAKLTKEEKKEFFDSLFSLLLYRISGVVINGTGNIIISRFIGLATVGLYSNYVLILSTINTLISQIFYSLTASVGNLNVNESKEKKYSIFLVLQFMNFWIYGFITVCLWNLLNPIITIWLGKEFTFNEFIVFTIILNFFSTGMQTACTAYRETTGLFKKAKYNPVFATMINLSASITLAINLGVAGVLLGTVISRLCTYFWYDPYTIYKHIFERPLISYYKKYCYYLSLVVLSALLTDGIAELFPASAGIEIVIRSVLCLFIPNLLFFVLFKKSEPFLYLMNVFNMLMNKHIVGRMNKKVYQSN